MTDIKRLTFKLNQYFKGNIKFTIINESEEYKEDEDNIEWMPVISDSYIRTMIIVTKEDKVYAIKTNLENTSLILLNKGNAMIDTFIINELCNKSLIDVKTGSEHMVGLSCDGKVYYWAHEYKKSLDEEHDDDYVKPGIHEYLNDQNIIEICSGDGHTLALTSNGDVYAWGINEMGQVGVGNEELYPTPIKLNGFDGQKIISISCGFLHSMALTEDGNVYSWGDNEFGQLGIGESIKNVNEPIKVRIEFKIKKVICGRLHSLFLNYDGIIFAVGSNLNGQIGIGSRDNQMSPVMINCSEKFVDIAAYYTQNISLAMSENNKLYGWGCYDAEPGVVKDEIRNIIEPEVLKFESFEHFFEKYLELTFKPNMNRMLFTSDSYIQNGRFKEEFEEISKIGSGGYGEVFKVKYKISVFEDYYAIKKIWFPSDKESELLKELKIFFTVNKMDDQKRAVLCLDAWIENDKIGFPKRRKSDNIILYLLMELCDDTLQKLIDNLRADQNIKTSNSLTLLGFYVSSYIFIQVLKGVNTLHKDSRQPIIHRDLKPDNILLRKELELNKDVIKVFVKIGDFGLITMHAFAEQTHSEDKGDIEYMAPEVYDGDEYNTKADIYSLGILLKQLFCLEIKRFNLINLSILTL